jgi:DNA-binding response OmpR family regulator
MTKTSNARVLVVEDVELEATLLIRALEHSGFPNVSHAVDVASALQAVESDTPPHIIVTDRSLGGPTGCELTRAIRTRTTEDYIYIVMLTGDGSAETRREAFESGIDDFLLKPFRADEMVARMRAGERITDLESRLRARSRELETALRRIDVRTARHARGPRTASVAPPTEHVSVEALTHTPTWTGAEDLLAKSLADFFQLPCLVTPVNAALETSFVADVVLSEPGQQLEVGLSVLADDPSMLSMASHLFGEADLESANALILEVANTMMGALKTAFSDNGLAFTGSIPTGHGFHEARETQAGHAVVHALSFQLGDASVQVWLRARERPSATVLARDLVEGMVLRVDVHDAKGHLFVRAGSRLTQTAAERIARFAPDLEIVVGNPRAA